MGLFVRESGPADAPGIVFLHGGVMSGWTWEPVVEQLQRYCCLVPDLPQYGKSFRQGPFDMDRAAAAVAEIIRTRTATGRAHVIGHSLGAQVGIQLLATEPQLVERALLSSAFVNIAPAVHLTRSLAGLLARSAFFRWSLINRYWDARHAAQNPAYRDDARLNSGPALAHIATASAGFTLPRGLDKSYAPTLFVTGHNEPGFMRHRAAVLARSMPNGVDKVAKGMGHDWPLQNPELFAHAVDAWVCQTALPPEIAPPTFHRRWFTRH